MPTLTAADLVTIRTRPIGRDFSFYIFQPSTTAVLTVGGSPSTGDRTMTTSTDSGDPSLALADQTCWVTDSAGNPKLKPSKVRFKSWAANTLVVAENAMEWVAGDIITIVLLFEIWPRVPWFDPATGIQYKDRTIAWSDDATAQPPKSNAGPAAIETLSGGTVDVTFKAYLSWSTLAPLPNLLPFLLGEDTSYGGAWPFECPTGVPPSGGYTWAAHGGSPTIAAGGVNSSSITFRYTTAGCYYVSLTCVDGNGKNGVRFVPVIIDDGTLAQSYTVPGDRSWNGRGWGLSRRVLSIAAEADNANWYDGAPCFLVADSTGAAERAFAGNRQNLRWSGWLVEDTTRRSAYSREVSFRALSTNDILANIPAFPTAFRSSAAPTDWYEFSQLSIDAVVYLLLRWHSTADIVTDYFPMGETAWTARLRPGENCRGQDLLSQINYVLKAAKADLRCDRQGTLRGVRDEWYLSAAEQAARDTVMTLALGDIQSVDYGPSYHHARTREVRLDGVSGDSTPYLSGSPGDSPLDGGKPMEEKNLAPLTQAELDQWSGQQLARENWQVPLEIKMAGEYDVYDPALGELVGGSLSSLDTRFPDGPYSVASVSFDDNSEKGVTISTVRLLPNPGQYEAEARPLPESAPATPDPPVLPDLPPVVIDEPVGTGERCGVGGEGGFFYSSDARTGSPPTWTAYNTGLSDATFIQSLAQDPRRSSYAACIDDSGGVFVTSDWLGGSAWTSVLTAAQAKVLIEAADAATTVDPVLSGVWCFAKSTDPNGVLVVPARYHIGAGLINEKTRVLFSTDWGANWTVGGDIPSLVWLATTYFDWIIIPKDNNTPVTNLSGAGELAFDGVNLIMAATAITCSGFNWSSDWGVTWQNPALLGPGDATANADGPRTARCLSTGTLIMSWWRGLLGGSDDHTIVSTADLGLPVSTVQSLTGTPSTNEYNDIRGMMDILADDTRAELFVDTGAVLTKVYLGGVLTATITGDECRTIQGFSEDEDFILVGRSWRYTEKASAADEVIIYRSTNKAATFADASGNLYALGARSVSGIIYDWVSDT